MKYIGIILCISALFFGNSFIRVIAQEQLQAQEQAAEEREFALIDRSLEVWTFIDDHRVITGKTLHVTVQIVWKLGITVNLEGVDKINLSPFRIEGVTLGERQIFDNEHDYMVITYALSLPSDIKAGIYSIPSFSLSYRNEVDKTEGMATSAPVAIKKVPILVEGKVDRDVITLGDRINYVLTIRHEKNVKLLWEDIEKLNFSPFEVLKKAVEKSTEGNIEKLVINYTLSLYELGWKKKTPEIPGLTILYYEDSRAQSNTAKADSASIETKEVKTVSIPIIINNLLKAVDVPLEGIKGTMLYSRKHIFLHGYLPLGAGIILFFFLGVTTLRSIAGRLSPASPKPVSEPPHVALERLKNTMKSFQFTDNDQRNRENIHTVNKALRAYTGTLLGISNDMAQSVTTSSFPRYDTQKQFSEETSSIIQLVLKQLDSLIFGKHIGKDAFDKILQGIEEIITQTGHKL